MLVLLLLSPRPGVRPVSSLNLSFPVSKMGAGIEEISVTQHVVCRMYLLVHELPVTYCFTSSKIERI